MISGQVNLHFEPKVCIFIDDSKGQPQPVDVTIDTGFTGFLSLPSALITGLGLGWMQKRNVQLADGSVVGLDVYSATVIWDGQPRKVEAYSCNSAPVIGMRILIGYEVKMRVIAGGPVWIDVVP